VLDKDQEDRPTGLEQDESLGQLSLKETIVGDACKYFNAYNVEM